MRAGFSSNGQKLTYTARAELVLVTCALVVLELAIPIITLQIYNRVLPNTSSGTLVILILAGFLAITLEFILRYTRSKIVSFRGLAQTYGKTREVVSTLLKADIAALDLRNNDLINRLGSVGGLRDFSSGYAFMTLCELVIVPIVLIALAIIAGPLVIVPIVVLIGFIALSLRNARTIREVSATRKFLDGERFTFIIETLRSAHLIKALGAEKQMSRRHEAFKATSTVGNFKVAVALTRMFDLSSLSANLITYGTVVFGAVLALNGSLTAGGLIASILLSGRLMPPIKRALGLLARRQEYDLCKKDVDDLVSTKSIASSPTATPEVRVENKGQLSINGLQFSHDGLTPILNDLSLEVQPGEVVSISGAAGCGGTTLMNIIAGVQQPHQGEVRVNGHPVLDFSPQNLAQHVGYIRTRSTIYRGTIMDNLTRFGETAFSDVAYVARLLGVDKDVAKLPAGYETLLAGDEADPIPPGLKQRIGMVRSLASRPRLILFDNADAALDRESYEITYQLFDKLRGKITLILSTNDSFLQGLAGRSFELADGQLTEQGYGSGSHAGGLGTLSKTRAVRA